MDMRSVITDRLMFYMPKLVCAWLEGYQVSVKVIYLYELLKHYKYIVLDPVLH